MNRVPVSVGASSVKNEKKSNLSLSKINIKYLILIFPLVIYFLYNLGVSAVASYAHDSVQGLCMLGGETIPGINKICQYLINLDRTFEDLLPVEEIPAREPEVVTQTQESSNYLFTIGPGYPGIYPFGPVHIRSNDYLTFDNQDLVDHRLFYEGQQHHIKPGEQKTFAVTLAKSTDRQQQQIVSMDNPHRVYLDLVLH